DVYRGAASGAETFLGTTAGTAYSDATVAAGATYYYAVTAANAAGEGPRSNEVSAAAGAVPAAPRALTVASASASAIGLSWSAPSSDGGSPLTAYDVYRGAASGAETLLGTTTATSYSDASVAGGETYYYTVTASNAVGESLRSGEVSAIAGTAPSAPRDL